MPKNVDHDKRREELLEAAWTVIVRDGMDAATIRSIAKETGWSSGVLDHYFADKDDILVSTLRLAHTRIAGRWDEKLSGLTGMAALRELALDNLPLDEERERETRLLMNYWSRSMRAKPGGVGVYEPKSWRSGPLRLDRFSDHVREGQEAGEIDSGWNPDEVAMLLMAVVDGLSLHALIDPGRFTPALQEALVDQELGRLTVPQGERHA
ncbi:MAG: transcriptional regulator [Marmoricola sp.]|nr:transcriptional regulator [Marmoricola sp.]